MSAPFDQSGVTGQKDKGVAKGDALSYVAGSSSSGFLEENMGTNEGFFKGVSETLTKYKDEFSQISSKDLGTVSQNLLRLVKEDLENKPYQTLATAFGIGFGIASLNVAHLKRGAIQIGKMMAIKALNEMEPKNNSDHSEAKGAAEIVHH